MKIENAAGSDVGCGCDGDAGPDGSSKQANSAILLMRDGGQERPEIFNAVRVESSNAVSQLQTTAVRVPNAEKFAKVVRYYYHDLPTPFSKRLPLWVASPKTTYASENLFATGLADGDDFKKSFEASLVDRSGPPTLDQRCADWFLLRHFSLTASASTKNVTAAGSGKNSVSNGRKYELCHHATRRTICGARFDMVLPVQIH